MTLTTTKNTLAAILLTTTLATGAFAADDRSVTHDSAGKIVSNSFGHCVRSDITSGGDECAPTPPPAPAPQPVAVVIPAKTSTTTLDKEARSVYFEFNKSNLTADATSKLDTLTTAIKADTQFKDARIVGYADRIGSTSYNEKLSQKRAIAVRDYLSSHGVITLPNTETRWLGDTQPTTNCPAMKSKAKLIECLQKDRRVEVEIDYQTTTPAQ